MAGPVLMFDHALDELKGWPDESALDFDAYLSPTVSVDPVYGGSVVHIDTEGQFQLGNFGCNVAIFLLQGSNELDVSNPGGSEWVAINPTGKMSGLVATGGYELETTEYYQNTGVDYLPGTPLHAPTEAQITGTNKVLAGKLFKTKAWPGGSGNLVIGTDSVSAVVSRRAHVNHHRRNVVSFHPVFAPGTETA